VPSSTRAQKALSAARFVASNTTTRRLMRITFILSGRPGPVPMRMAVAIYVTGISIPEVHHEFPPVPETLTIFV
jgi:hypothetical protein